MNATPTRIRTDKKQYLDLLLLGDEQESMIDRYLERGEMFVLEDNGVKAVCVVTDEGGGTYELKNIAVVPHAQRQGYGSRLIRLLINHYSEKYDRMLVGTGDVPTTVRFYRHCGFVYSHRIGNFFIDNYNHPIVEDGIWLKDMVYLKYDMKSDFTIKQAQQSDVVELKELCASLATVLAAPISFSLFPGITLREVRMEDAAAIFRAIDTHRDYLRTWLPFVNAVRSVADEEAFLRSVLDVPADKYDPIFGVVNEREEICGLIGFHFSDRTNHRTEIGYWLLPEYQHRGIVTEGVRLLCRWAVKERDIRRIQIRCAVGNEASNRVPLRLGFQYEGTERAGELLASGEYADINVYSILKEEVALE